MSHSAVSPQQLGEHVARIAETATYNTEGYDDDYPDRAPLRRLQEASHGMCNFAAEAIEDHLEQAGVRVHPLEFSTGVHHMANHYATEVPTTAGPHVVDLAYGQYEHGVPKKRRAPWPLVEPKDAYLKRTGFTVDP